MMSRSMIMSLTDGGTWHLYAGVGRLLIGVDGVAEDADERGGYEEEPAKLPVEAAIVSDHKVDVAYETSHPCCQAFMNSFCIAGSLRHNISYRISN